MTVFGYLRVSTVKQCENNYKHAILEMANEKKLGSVTWISETVSGRKDWRKRELGKCFELMKEGDIIIMAELSRIGRDFLNNIEFLAECKRKNVTVLSIINDIPLQNDATSNMMLALNSWKSQIERENLSYRTKIGLAHAKENGRTLGRKREMILDKDLNNIRLIKDDIEKGIQLKYICKKYDCTYPTLKKFILKHDLKKNKTEGDILPVVLSK